MATSDFLAFASAGGANVISQSTYAALAALGPGFSTGIAPSDQLNKVWRQSSIMSAVLASFMATVSTVNSVDDGTTATLLTSLMTCFGVANFGVDSSGAANVYTVNFSPAMSVLNGTKVRFTPAHTNNGASTLSVNSSTAEPILGTNLNALVGGELVATIPIEATWSTAHTAWIINTNPGTAGLQVAASITGAGVISRQSGSVTVAVTHTGTGVYTLTFSPAFPNANYVVLATPGGTSAGGTVYSTTGNRTTSTVIISQVNTSSDTSVDSDFNVAVLY